MILATTIALLLLVLVQTLADAGAAEIEITLPAQDFASIAKNRDQKSFAVAFSSNSELMAYISKSTSQVMLYNLKLKALISSSAPLPTRPGAAFDSIAIIRSRSDNRDEVHLYGTDVDLCLTVPGLDYCGTIETSRNEPKASARTGVWKSAQVVDFAEKRLGVRIHDPIVIFANDNTAAILPGKFTAGVYGPIIVEITQGGRGGVAQRMYWTPSYIDKVRWSDARVLQISTESGIVELDFRKGNILQPNSQSRIVEIDATPFAIPAKLEQLSAVSLIDFEGDENFLCDSEDGTATGGWSTNLNVGKRRSFANLDDLRSRPNSHQGAGQGKTILRWEIFSLHWFSDGRNRALELLNPRDLSRTMLVICAGEKPIALRPDVLGTLHNLVVWKDFIFLSVDDKEIVADLRSGSARVKRSAPVRAYVSDPDTDALWADRSGFWGRTDYKNQDTNGANRLDGLSSVMYDVGEMLETHKPANLARFGNYQWSPPRDGSSARDLAIFDPSGAIYIYRRPYPSADLVYVGGLFLSPEGYLFITAEGFFLETGRADMHAKINFSVDGRRRSMTGLYEVFNRPDIVRAKLVGENISQYSGGLTVSEALNKPPPSVSFTPLESEQPSKHIRISFAVKSDGRGGVGEVLVFHNGKLIKSDGYYRDAPGSTLVEIATTKANSGLAVSAAIRKMLDDGESAPAAGGARVRNSVVIRQAKPKVLNAAGEYHDSVDVEVIPGEDNEITVMARNADNTILGQGQTVRFKSTLPKAEPHLWILPVGIGSFADRSVPALASPKKDALDFACSYGGKEALRAYGLPCNEPGYATGLFKPSNIHVAEPLTNEKATRANILAKLDEVAAKARPGDTFVWFVSSHGTMDGNSVYGIVPFDAKCKGSDCDGLVTSNDILDKSKAIKAMKQLLVLDTCQAGGLDNKMSGLYDARMAGLAKNMGLHLYAAATATESALDGQDASKNSVFTATLLEGLAGKAPKNGDGSISVIPLGQYVKDKTPEAARQAWGGDTVQTPLVQHFGKDAPLAAGSSSGLR